MAITKRTRIMRAVKTIAGIVAATAIFYGIVQVFNYMYVDSNDSWFQRFVLHDFYEDTSQIENLYLGSSHVYCDINPMYLDNINGYFNFNLATPGQLPNGTFHLLREADHYNELSHVYVELYYRCYINSGVESDDERIYTELYRTWQNSDYMKLSVNKLAYMFSTAHPEQYTDLCIPFSRYRTQLDDWSYIQQVMEERQQEKFIDYRYSTETMEYMGKGYFCFNQVVDDCDKRFYQADILGDNPIGKTSEKYLRKTIEYCQMRDIPITLFVSPIYELQLVSTENYDNYVEEVKTIAEEYDVDFYDFNLAKEEYLPIQHGEYFMNIEHLNGNGGDIYTPFFYKVVSGEAADNDKYFYDAYAEKLQNAAPEIYGIYYRNPEEVVEGEEAMKTMWIASNRDSGMEYRIIITPNEGEQYMIQEFDENKEFMLPMSEHGICTIVARMKETPDEVQTLEINF